MNLYFTRDYEDRTRVWLGPEIRKGMAYAAAVSALLILLAVMIQYP